MKKADKKGEAEESTQTRSWALPAAAFPEPMCERELEQLWKRRRMAGIAGPGEPTRAAGAGRPQLPADTIGVALSGGGIRSATFCLGVFQGLARNGWIRRIDYLSTVSGGGYFGSFIGRLFTRSWLESPGQVKLDADAGTERLRNHRPVGARKFLDRLADQTTPVDRAEAVLQDNHSPPITWLRESGNYLMPSGSKSSLLAAAIFMRNWIAVLAVILVTLLTVYLGGNFLRSLLQSWDVFYGYEIWLQGATDHHLWWTPWFFVPLVVLALMVVPFGWAYWLTQAVDKRQFACVALANGLVIGVGLLVFELQMAPRFLIPVGVAGIEAGLALILTWGLGFYYCHCGGGRSLLPEPRLRAVVIAVASAHCLWGMVIHVFTRWPQWPTVGVGWLVLAAVLLMMPGMFYLAMRERRRQQPKAGREAWNLHAWWQHNRSEFVFLAIASLLPLLLTGVLCANRLEPEAWAVHLVRSLALLWAAGSLLVLFYSQAHQVLLKDRQARLEGVGGEVAALTPWLRSSCSTGLRHWLLIFAALQVLALLNCWGQSLYALVMFQGGLKFAVGGIGGVAVVGGLAPLVRSLALRSKGVKEGLQLPLKLIALAGAFLLILLLALSISFIANGISWRWQSPVFEAPIRQILQSKPSTETAAWKRWTNSIVYRVSRDLAPDETVRISPLEALAEDWRKGLVDDWRRGLVHEPIASTNLAAITNMFELRRTYLTNSPGGTLAARWFTQRDVALNPKHLVEVKEADGHAEPAEPRSQMVVLDLGLSFALGLGLTVLFGRTISFLNLSSFHSFYSDRVLRAFQGATNPERWEADASIHASRSGDDLPWHAYKPQDNGGPMHLVNSTLNCTVSQETNMESTTAKGMNLCVGPCGLSFGRHHALGWTKPRPEDGMTEAYRLTITETRPDGHSVNAESTWVEALTLGSWVGISGAAFTTGLGNVGMGGGTALGTSMLCGMFNVRLGYWWRNYFSANPKWESLHSTLCVQRHLFDEFLGNFRIEGQDRWYLSDGGHFENTAAYELIRRRVPFIVICDCGADPDGNFDDLANLVRRVRIDFEAEITFLEDLELAENVHADLLAPGVKRRVAKAAGKTITGEGTAEFGRIGTLADLHPQSAAEGERPQVRAHATLARVNYPGEATSLLLIIKPGITPDLPADLLNYQNAQPTFPQQTTLDQFFDEAQWESYRKLGDLVTGRLFRKPDQIDGAKWYPAQMVHWPAPPPPAAPATPGSVEH